MRVMIADDESVVRHGIIEGIEWEKYGISDIRQAVNGYECMKIMRTVPVDILITDIRMPRINGVSLGGIVSEEFPNCSIIFISAYTDKEYLKSAISLNVVAYVEKPIILGELSAAIEKACLISNQSKRVNDTRQLSLLFRSQLVRKNANDNYEVFPAIMGKLVCCILFHFNFYDDFNSYVDQKIIDDIFSLYNTNIIIFGDILKEYYIGVCWCDDGSTPCNRCYTALDSYSSKYCGGNLFASIGISVEPNKLYSSYLSAQTYLDRKFYIPDSIVRASTPSEVLISDYIISSTIIEKLRNSLFNRMKPDFVDAVQQLKMEILNGNYSVESVKQAALSVLDLIKTYIPEYEYDLITINKIARCTCLNELITILVRESNQIVYYCDNRDQICIDSIRIISENYNKNELSLNYICTKLNVGKSKLCSQFRQGTGKSINEYITQYRMAVAKELIEQNKYLLRDVAKAVGYNDVNYFSKVFKKNYGILPCNYKVSKEE